MLYPRTISDQRTESQCKSRNILFDEDRSALRARLVDGRYNSFIIKKTGRVMKATEDQMISSQVWKIL